MTVNIQELFGEIDIYVFDQILRGNIAPGMRILDAGCGFGRNLVYLLRENAEIFAIDASPRAVEHVRALSKSLNTNLPSENFQVGRVEQMLSPPSSPMSSCATLFSTSLATTHSFTRCSPNCGVSFVLEASFSPASRRASAWISRRWATDFTPCPTGKVGIWSTSKNSWISLRA